MTDSAWRPLLFLDVDGPLIPFGATPRQLPGGYPTFPDAPELGAVGTNPLLSRLDPGLGLRLVALGCELVWATTWMEEANECVAPRLGLPRLPVVLWPEPDQDEGRDGLHWKTRGLLAWAGGRRLSGWTTRSPVLTGGGWPRTIQGRPCCTGSTPLRA